METKNRISWTLALVALVGAALAALIFGSPLAHVSAASPPVRAVSFRPDVLANSQSTEVIASGLNNPRGLSFGPEGALYAAEAGSGGAGLCAEGPEGLRCYGTTGSITRIDLRSGVVTRVASGIPSLALADGSFATGIQDISFNGLGSGAFTMGWGGDPADRAVQFEAAGADFARLGRINAFGNWSIGEDLGDFERAANPTGDEIDSNPYGIWRLPASGSWPTRERTTCSRCLRKATYPCSRFFLTGT